MQHYPESSVLHTRLRHELLLVVDRLAAIQLSTDDCNMLLNFIQNVAKPTVAARAPKFPLLLGGSGWRIEVETMLNVTQRRPIPHVPLRLLPSFDARALCGQVLAPTEPKCVPSLTGSALHVHTLHVKLGQPLTPCSVGFYTLAVSGFTPRQCRF
jgi:hypothetical protein